MIEIVEIAFVENIALTVVDELMTSLEDEHSGLTLKGVRGGLPPVIVPPSELVPLSHFASDVSKAVTGQILYVDHGTTL
jgi:hypothetical protein